MSEVKTIPKVEVRYDVRQEGAPNVIIMIDKEADRAIIHASARGMDDAQLAALLRVVATSITEKLPYKEGS